MLRLLSLLVILAAASVSGRRTSNVVVNGRVNNWRDHSSRTFFFNHGLNYPTLIKISTTPPTAQCICVAPQLCSANGTLLDDTLAFFDIIRYRKCLTGEVCCHQPPEIIEPTATGTLPVETFPTVPATTKPPVEPTSPDLTVITILPTIKPPSLNCLCVPLSQCDSNGFLINYGEGQINPRQTAAFCPLPDYICCKYPSTGVQYPTDQYTLNTPSPTPPKYCICVDKSQCTADGYLITDGSGVIIPRLSFDRIVTTGSGCPSVQQICCKIRAESQSGMAMFVGTSQSCRCVKSWQCTLDNVVPPGGTGIIDPRFGACPFADEVCCLLNTLPVAPNVVLPSQPRTCGRQILLESSVPSNQFRQAGDAYFGEFPWMVALLARNSAPNAPLSFVCGASMISERAVLTAAHCVTSRSPNKLVARFGEYDTQHNNEPLSFQDAEVQHVIVHPQYSQSGLFHDLAILILARPVAYTSNILPICLAEQGTVFANGTVCYGSGWGRDAFMGKYQNILRKVALPLVDNASCQSALRSTRLGPYFRLHESFLCAGGELSRDTCKGDGGGPLMCRLLTGAYVQIGIVAWGISCGEQGVPAVYANVAQHRAWINTQLASYGIY